MNYYKGVDNPTVTSKPGGTCVSGSVQQKPVYRLGGVRRGGGASLIQARSWNWENSRYDDKGRGQVKKSKAASTDACVEDGPIRSSVEAAVMAAEHRDRVIAVELTVNSSRG